MKIRHCVEQNNVDENLHIIDPTKIRHVIIKAGKIDQMSGLIDPKSHLNLDFPNHRVTNCVIAESFTIGAKIRKSDNGWLFATVTPNQCSHLGFLDYSQRLSLMIQKVKESLEKRS